MCFLREVGRLGAHTHTYQCCLYKGMHKEAVRLPVVLVCECTYVTCEDVVLFLLSLSHTLLIREYLQTFCEISERVQSDNH